MTCKNQGNFITHLTMAIDELEYPISVTRLGNFSKYLATNKLPKSPTFLGNFCTGVFVNSGNTTNQKISNH